MARFLASVSWASLRNIVVDLVELSGVRFSPKVFRTSCAQVAKGRGVVIESVSRAMRRRSTKSTERHDARMRPEAAFRELREKCPTPVVTR